jgi:hypothetical protein
MCPTTRFGNGVSLVLLYNWSTWGGHEIRM